ncbi:MAG: tetratricopeptide repeat protein [Anaerolineae bacterium]|nr:tetratricopeptide repeat protein [Anaerolineae bacterium]MDW8171172.1 tetratricopeptide repeat protein [Anaerolineae bacterium]
MSADFRRLVEEGDNAAWNKDWRTAIERYAQALKLVPDDPEVHISLGLALISSQQLERALAVFKRATELAPDDPVPLESCADVLERMGQLKEAAQNYVKVADIYLAQRDFDRAIGNWERATQLTPGLTAIHARLAQAYERIGQNSRAVREYLTLAFNFRRQNETDKAIRAVERALKLDKNNAQALNALRALQAGGEVVLPQEEARKRPEPKKSQAEADLFLDSSFGAAAQDEGRTDDERGPIGKAVDEALETLAAYVVEAGLDMSAMAVLQAMEMQRQGQIDKAIAAYQQALQMGLRHPALQLNLGALLVEADRPKEAIRPLGEAMSLKEATSGALHGMALAYLHMGELLKAARTFIQCLKAIDLSAGLSGQEAQEAALVYDNLASVLEGRNQEALNAINDRFVQLLGSADWRRRVPEMRRQLHERRHDEGDQGMIDFLVARVSEDQAVSIVLIDRYIHQGLYTLAMDEAQRAIEQAPFYLPLHVRMAEIMMKEGRIRPAINKYAIIARSYMVRDEVDRAASILFEVLEMAPLDVDIRTTLIELLESENRFTEALDQVIELALTYQQLGDFEKSMQTLGAADRLARRIGAPTEKLVEIKHALADIHQMRLNTRMAQKVYDEILEIAPQDEKALRQQIDILYGQGNQVEAVKRLDALLGIYAKKGMVTRITQLLEQLVNTYQKDTALRARLASIYKRLGQVQKAVEQLDALGELQLDAGLNKDAANTIRQIIAMKPERVEEYIRLLQQLNA